MTAMEIFTQNDGRVTMAYYEEMNAKGSLGKIAVALFRAQKRSVAAKRYKRGQFRRRAYDVKNWSMSELCRLLTSEPHKMLWGWKRDPDTPGYEWVLYVDLPTGQVSFHSPQRIDGPDYPGDWDHAHASVERIIAFCDQVASEVRA